MNKMILVIMFFAGIISANAQPAYNAASANGINQKSTDNEEIGTMQTNDPFAATDYSLKNNVITFSGLPADKHLRVYITNAEGAEEYNKKLSTEHSSIDLSSFHKGLYYVTLLSKDNKRKVFRINL